MIMMYKILNSLDGLPFDDLFSFHHTVTRTNGYKLYKKLQPPELQEVFLFTAGYRRVESFTTRNN